VHVLRKRREQWFNPMLLEHWVKPGAQPKWTAVRSMRDEVHSVRMRSIRINMVHSDKMQSIQGQDYSVVMTLFWGRSGQKRRLSGACVALEEGAFGSFGFCHFPIGFTADRFKPRIRLILIHFKADRCKSVVPDT
jgi:hypothetical protein